MKTEETKILAEANGLYQEQVLVFDESGLKLPLMLSPK
jgi:hypothetical protein